MNKTMWFDIREILSHNCLLNFVVGNRGGGKTYGAIKEGIKYFLKNNKKFVYLRRYKTEFGEVSKLLTSICEDEDFKDYVISNKGKKIFICRKDECLKEDGEIDAKILFHVKHHCGDCIALSVTPQLKSMDFKDYYYMFFDEYRVIKSNIHYIPNEINVFLEWLETFARMRFVRVIFFGNNLTAYDPYFIYFNLKENKDKIVKFNNKMIAVQYYTNTEYIQAKKESPVGRLVEGTTYGRYAIENDTLIGNSKFIKKKSSNSYYAFSISFKNEKISIWLDYKLGEIYCSFNIPKGAEEFYPITKEDMSPNMMFLKSRKNSHYLSMLRNAYENGYLFYENEKINFLMEDVIKYLNI